MNFNILLLGDEQWEDQILGLDKTIFFVIVGAGVFFILIISFAIYLRIKRHRTYREAKLKKKMLVKTDAAAQGVAFQPTDVDVQDGNGGRSGEEIDLKVFDNDAVRLDDEEIKIQP